MISKKIDQMIQQITYLLSLLCGVLSAAEEQWVVVSHGLNVPFHSWRADGAKASHGVLVLVPGYNGAGAQMLDARWKAFATKNHLVLLAPTFRAVGNENNEGRGYYYPQQGSGEVMEKALTELKKRTGVKTEKVLFFGFSAGAHYAHRFAIWKPQRVKAFVAYSAGWWTEPTPQLKSVPALIMCGEADGRYPATYDFFRKGHALGCPWIWRSYDQTDHTLTPAVRSMAEVFLTYYINQNTNQVTESWSGDFQTFKKVKLQDKDIISLEYRIELPSTEIASIWEKEK